MDSRELAVITGASFVAALLVALVMLVGASSVRERAIGWPAGFAMMDERTTWGKNI